MTTKILSKNNKIAELVLDSKIENELYKILAFNPSWSMNDAILHFLKLGIMETNKKKVLNGVEIDYSDYCSTDKDLEKFFEDSIDEDIVLDWSKVKKFV